MKTLLLIILSVSLVISIGINVFLARQRGVVISFEDTISPSPIPTITSLPTNSPSTSTNFSEKKVLGNKITIPIKNASGETISEIFYTLSEYEITSEVIVQGKKAMAIAGRAFLIVNLKVENTSDQTIQIQTKDYLRLSIGGSNEWIAADIHNDPVEVQAKSTKFTKIGFPINKSDTNLKLQLGEINNQKEIINLD